MALSRLFKSQQKSTHAEEDPNKFNYTELMDTKIKKIGKGSFGSLYLADWYNQVIAIKRSKKSDDFYIEKKILSTIAKLNSPYIVKYIGYSIENSEINTHYCIIMEYVPHTLENHIYNNNPFDWALRYQIIETLISGVVFLHENNIIHCDIKSANTLITHEGNAKLCDFGLSVYADDNKHFNAGTAAWASPEVLADNKVLTKSDIFSLAITIWEIATWRFPCAGMALFEIVFYRLTEDYRDPIPADVPKNITHLITLGWMKDPEQRPNAKEMLEKLHSLI